VPKIAFAKHCALGKGLNDRLISVAQRQKITSRARARAQPVGAWRQRSRAPSAILRYIDFKLRRRNVAPDRSRNQCVAVTRQSINSRNGGSLGRMS
jgi:hypothetical protein